MNKKDLDALNELYSSVYDEEQLLNEGPYGADAVIAVQELQKKRDLERSNKQKQISANLQAAKDKENRAAPAGSSPRQMQQASIQGILDRQKARGGNNNGWNKDNLTKTINPKYTPQNIAKAQQAVGIKPAINPNSPKPASAPTTRPATRPAAAPATRPAASTSPGTPKVAPTKPAGSPMDQWRAANPKLAAAADEKARIRGTQQTDNPLMKDMRSNLPMNSPSVQSPAVAKLGAGNQSLVNNPNAFKAAPPKPAAPAAKPAEAPKRETQLFSYQWPSAKTIREIAGAYASIYEAKKKVDQDEDGDNDFADIRIARMIASGVPKAKAIAMVKDKSYNEEVELWVNELIEEGYDLSGYTWDDMFEIYEATAMAKRGYDETEIRNKIAKSTGGGEAADRATELENRPTFGQRGVDTQARKNYARAQKGAFRDTTSSNPGLHGYAHKSNDPAVKAKQAARGKQRSALTPREKKMLNREAYETYEFVASYLLENNFANTIEDANVIINNMSEGWFESIVEEKKPLPVSKMKKKESKLLDNEEGHLQALRTDVGSKERKARMKELQRFDNINSVRTSVAKRGGKQQHSMPEIGRFKPKDED